MSLPCSSDNSFQYAVPIGHIQRGRATNVLLNIQMPIGMTEDRGQYLILIYYDVVMSLESGSKRSFGSMLTVEEHDYILNNLAKGRVELLKYIMNKKFGMLITT